MADRSEDIKKKLRQPTGEEKVKILTAAGKGDLTTLQQLHSSGVDVTGDLGGGWTGLHCAARWGRYDAAVALLKWGAEVDAVDRVYKWTPLLLAAQHDHPHVMSLLISHGADVNMKDLDWNTPLVWAVRGSSSAAVYYLIKEVGVDPTQCPQWRQKEMKRLLKKEDMKRLLKKEEESKQQDTFERIAYALALSKGRAKALGIKLLLFGPENVGKTCLVSTMIGDPYQEETATEGADVSILNTIDWAKVSDEEVLDRLHHKFLRDWRESAKDHREVAMSKALAKTASPSNPDKSLPEKATAKPKFLETAIKFFLPWIKKGSTDKHTITAFQPANQEVTRASAENKLDAAEIKQAAQLPSIDVEDEHGIDVSILDFAGQVMYHSTHSVLIRKDNIIMVVFNAFRPLSSNVKVRSSTLRGDPMTNSENVHFWMKTVHAICHVPGDDKDKADLLPVILLVATHIDLLGDSAEKAKEDIIQQLAQELEGKPYALHLAGHREGLDEALRKYCIFISNKCRNPAEIARLHEAVFELSQPILSKEYPVVYLKIERRLFSTEKGVLTTEEFHAITEHCGFPAAIDSKEFAGALDYFHDRGTVLHFSSVKSLNKLVFLSPHWLTKLISYLLLAHPYKRIGGRRDKSFHLLIENGILLVSFLSYMLDLFNKSECRTGSVVAAQEAIDLMKKFGFVAEISSSTCFLEEQDSFYQEEALMIVPTLLPEDPQNDKQIPPEDDPNTMVVNCYFPDGFISPTIYNNMVAECINWNTEKHEDLIWLRKGKVKMVLGNGQDYCVSLAEEEHCIKLFIILSADIEHSAKQRRDLLEFFQSKLKDIVKDFMPASKIPIAYIPCFYCDQLHARVEVLLEGKQLRCPVKDKPLPKDHYCSLVTDQELNVSVASSIEASSLTVAAEKPTYPVLIDLLEKVVEWKLVAAHLLNDQDGSKTKEIEKTYHGDVADCRAEMIRLFLKGGDVSWQSVLTALRKAGYKNLADKYEKLHVPMKCSVAAKKKMSYPELLKWIKKTEDWQLLATYLLNEDTASRNIDIIENKGEGKIIKCQIGLARMYTESTDVEVSWRRVYNAFINADCNNIAEDIKKKYLLK